MVKNRILKIIELLFTAAVALIIIAPIIMTLFQSLEAPFGYIDFFLWKPKYLNAFVNSLIMAGLGAGGCVIISIGAAYVFSKVEFPGRTLLLFLYIIVMMIPFQVTMLPMYITMRSTELYDSLWAVILPNTFSAFGVFLLTQIMKTIPNDTIESARLETGSTAKILFFIIIPQVRSGILCLFSLMFTEIWNMLAEPTALIESISKLPISVLIAQDTSPAGIAAIIIATLPPLLLYAFFREEIISGLGYYKLH